MDRFKALRLQALQAVLDPDNEANLRHIFRWYSKTFHTPLHIVSTLDEDDVLIAFYEASFEEMSEDDREKEKFELLETDEQRKARLRALDASRMESFEFARFTAAEEKAKKVAEIDPAKVENPLTSPAFKAATKSLAPASALPKVDAEKAPKMEPDIEMKFVSADDFERELEGYGPNVPSPDGKKPKP